MAAGITTVDGMFYVGQVPWHKLGVALESEATAAEAIAAAGMDWTVSKRRITAEGGAETDYYRAIVRDDTQEILTIQTDAYEPIQNSEAFSFFDGVVGAGEAIYHTAGSLLGGRRVWILAKLPDGLDLGGDKIEPYVLLANSHDGKMKMTMKPTTVRVVCMNTLDAALEAQSSRTVRYRHVGNIFDKVNDAREGLGLVRAYNQLLFQSIERLADARISDDAAHSFFERVLGYDPDKKPEEQRAVAKSVEQVQQLYVGGAGSEYAAATGTAWGAYNAVTELVEHCYASRAEKDLDAAMERRFLGVLFGDQAEVRQRAYEQAYALVPATVRLGGQ